MKKAYWVTFVILACVTSMAFWLMRRSTPLQDTDYLLLGEIANHSGDPVLDDSLREAVRVGLSQSPHLNLINDEKVRGVLRQTGKSDTQPADATVAAQICAGLDAAAYLTGLVEHSAGDYRVELNVNRCKDGARLAKSSGSAPRPDLLIHQLGVVAVKLREQLGESHESIQKFDIPLDRATSPMPAALKAYADARKTLREQGDLAAVPLYRKAVDADSRFAIARSGLAVSLYNLNQMAEAADNIRQAYEAGDRQTARERLNISTLYYDLAQGDVEKAIEGYKEYIRIYPRDDVATGNLSSEFFVIGDYEQAAKYAEAALKLDPDSAAWYENYSTALLALGRTEQAEHVLKEAFERKMDDASLHSNMYSVGFVRNDQAIMRQELQWAEGRPGGDSLFAAQADTEAYYGRLNKARQLTQKAIEMAKTAGLDESAATWAVQGAMREAVLGSPKEARRMVSDALQLAPKSKDVRSTAAVIYAAIGDEQEARKIADDLQALFPSNIVIQKAWLPVVRAQLAINKRQYEQAVQELQTVSTYERGQLTGNLSDSCMVPVVLRGEAFLALKKSSEAYAEFQKIDTSPGLVGNCWSGSFAKLEMARAKTQSGAKADAKSWYEQLTKLWAEADPELTLMKQVKAEIKQVQ
jgi:eukaryotic-like serine/threonine-protein kinase